MYILIQHKNIFLVNRNYQPKSNWAVGFPLGPVLLLFMENFANDNFGHKPSSWFR